MSDPNNPHQKTSRADLLEHPYLANKLARLQGIHDYTEQVMDTWHRENLKAEGKTPERVRVTAKNPGPRTEKERRKAFRPNRGNPPKPKDEPDFFTLGEAAQHLGYECEKSVRRLIKKGKLNAEERVERGKRRWMVSRADLNSYREWDRLRRKIGPVPTWSGDPGDFGAIFVYGKKWKNKETARLPTHTLIVSIEEFWQFACKPLQSESDYEATKAALRSKIHDAPNDFQVRYILDDRAIETLERIIRFVLDNRRVNKSRANQGFGNTRESIHIQGSTRRELINDGLSHLQLKVLPSLWRAKRGWVAYLCQAVSNFFKDQALKHKRLYGPLRQLAADQDLSEEADLADQDLLSEAGFQNWEKSKTWGESNLTEPNDTPLSQQLTDQDLEDLRDLQESDLKEIAKRLDPEQFLIFTKHLMELRIEGNKPTMRAANRR